MTRSTPAETKLVICVWHPFTEWRPKPLLAESIRARYPEMRVLHLPNYETLPQELPDTTIFVGYSLRAEQLVHARELKWIHSTAAGVAQLMYPELQRSGITVTNASGIFSVPVAEHTMGLILAMARNFPDAVRYQDGSKWSVQDLWDKPQHLTEINRSVLLIVGCGSIGRELAQRAVNQRGTRFFAGRDSLDKRATKRRSRWRGARCNRSGTFATGVSVVEGGKSFHYAAYQRDQRAVVAARNGIVPEIARRMVQRERTFKSSRFFPRLLIVQRSAFAAAALLHSLTTGNYRQYGVLPRKLLSQCRPLGQRSLRGRTLHIFVSYLFGPAL